MVCDGVSVWFGPKVAVTELSCSFGAGVTGLLGPNGAGKTTLMRAMCGLLPTNRGAIRVLGADPRAVKRGVQQHLSLVPEDDVLLMTARQLVRYAGAALGGRTATPRRPAWPPSAWLDVADRRGCGLQQGQCLTGQDRRLPRHRAPGSWSSTSP